ncbi:threonine/serine exporter family protein [Gemmatimonas sp.]|uniref:threonine/serine ThrE exporter family protein n=1 Tax=Gemmatimonas sp. TaxID=1962908 RepID=UPI0025B901EF|nr:threonine/serine exporter family protein [Gemmatimonas sp.]MCA2992033.1 threonine/serine exporter family protein [Gemmatimonas sp.]
MRRTPAAGGDDLVSLDTPPAPGGALDAPAPAGASADAPEFAAARRFILQLARQLHQHGTPAHRLEVTLSVLARRLGVQAEFFSTPTSIMVGIGTLEQQRVHLLRVNPGEPNLGHLSRLGEIVRQVMDGDITPAEGLRRIEVMDAEPPAYPTWLVMVAFVLASTAIACFLKLRVGDVALAAALGLVTAVTVLTASRWESTRHVSEPLTAFIVTTLAFTMDGLLGTRTGYATSLAGLAILLPGLTFTVALTELSTRHLASGTARLSGAIVTFLGLGFGLALGAKAGGAAGALLRDLLPAMQGALPRTPLPWWTEWTGLLVAPLAFTVLLSARRQDAPLIVVACTAAYVTSKLAGAAVGEELGAFLGAFVVSAGSNILARVRRRVAMVTQVPGLLILVPGSIGFRSMTSLLGQEVETGIQTAFRVAIVGTSLAAGILAGNVVTRAANRIRP